MFEFFSDVPVRKNPMPVQLVKDVDEYTKAFEEQHGLIPHKAVPDFIGLSRQRFYKILEQRDFWTQEFFGVRYYSYKELVEFRQVDRKVGNAPVFAA